MEEDQPVDEKAEPWPTVTHTAEQEREPDSNTAVLLCSFTQLTARLTAGGAGGRGWEAKNAR